MPPEPEFSLCHLDIVVFIYIIFYSDMEGQTQAEQGRKMRGVGMGAGGGVSLLWVLHNTNILG